MDQLPRGLAFFAPGDKAHKRRRIGFCSLYLAAWLALQWPLYAMVEPVFPLVLGLPLSLAWIVLWMLVVFFGLIWLFRGDHPPGADRTRDR